MVPWKTDLPQSRFRLFKPAFSSTGMDCFGPYVIKVGRRNEKRWGILFKCMTTWAVYVDKLTSLDANSFLMTLRRFIACRGKPFKILRHKFQRWRVGAQGDLYSTPIPNSRGVGSQQIDLKFTAALSSCCINGARDRKRRIENKGPLALFLTW